VDEVVADLRQWFAESPERPWEDHREQLVRTHAGPEVDELVRRLDELPDHQRAEFVAGDELERVVAEVAQPVDDGAWQEYLAANGTQWDGTEENWPAFVEWFAFYADERGVGEPAAALLAQLGAVGVAERIALFGQHGVVITPPEPYDEAVWQDYLTTNGTQWDGTEENWPAFVEWFDFYAAERGVGEPATALTQHLGGLAVADRIATFAQYGVHIAAPEVSEVAEEVDVAAVAEAVVAENPAFADIPEARRRELVDEALAELAAETG
jgi:hypothetical protein